MGRKHDHLMGKPSEAQPPAPPPAPPQSSFKLASLNPAMKTVGAVFPPKGSEIRELDPAKIDPSSIRDRIDGGDEGHAELVALIRDHGQQVPILVRPHPDAKERYQIVYGRRRLRAAAELGIRVRAIVKELSEEELVVAQGQENSARADLSFIERALFAAALEDRGFSREVIMASLFIDKTTLSRLIKAAKDVPADLIAAIGPAPKAGRDRWVALAVKLKEYKVLAGAYKITRENGFGALPSDERFERIFRKAGQKEKAASEAPSTIASTDGQKLATLSRASSGLTLKLEKTVEADFGDHLASLIPELYAAWKGGADA